MTGSGPVTRPPCPALRRAAAYTEAPGSQRAASPQDSGEQPDLGTALVGQASAAVTGRAAPVWSQRGTDSTVGTPVLFGITRDAPSRGPCRSKRSGHTQAILQLPGCTPCIRSHPKPGLASVSRKL